MTFFYWLEFWFRLDDFRPNLDFRQLVLLLGIPLALLHEAGVFKIEAVLSIGVRLQLPDFLEGRLGACEAFPEGDLAFTGALDCEFGDGLHLR